jgi:hypothetical protein
MCFVTCYIKALSIAMIPGYVHDMHCSGNIFNCPAGAFSTVAGDISASTGMESAARPLASDFWGSADRGVNYDMTFPGAAFSRFTFLTDTVFTGQFSAGMGQVDTVHDYTLELEFRINDAKVGTELQYGLTGMDPHPLHGFQITADPTNTHVTITAWNAATSHVILNADSSFNMVFNLIFRRIANRLIVYLNHAVVVDAAYDDTIPGAFFYPPLLMSGGPGVNTTVIDIFRARLSSRTNYSSIVVDSIIKSATLEGSFNDYFNILFANGGDTSTDTRFIKSDTILPVDLTLPAFDGTRYDFYDIHLYFTLHDSDSYAGRDAEIDYPGYNVGLWGYERRNIGAFDFSWANVRYVNLDLGTSFGHSGTDTDPFAFFDLYAYVNVTRETTLFLLRGSHFNTAIYDFYWDFYNQNHVYRAWNFELYGPWRLRTKYGFEMNSGGCYVHDGIIIGLDETDTRVDIVATNAHPQFINCYLIGDYWSSWNLYPYAGIGCLVDFNTFDEQGIAFKDSLIKVTDLTGGGSVNSWVNCGISFVNNAIPSSHFLNCTLDWLPPPFPEWNDSDPMSWFYEDFITNIPLTIFDGDAPYTDYESGMFGLARLGIGALYFIDRIPVMPSDIKVSLRKMTSIFGVYHDAPPNLFSSPCQYRDCEPVAAPLPVDDYLFNTLYRGSVRLSFKTYNWIVEDNATIVIDVIKENPSLTEPEFLDIIVEGYFLKGEKSQ